MSLFVQLNKRQQFFPVIQKTRENADGSWYAGRAKETMSKYLVCIRVMGFVHSIVMMYENFHYLF